MFSGLSGKGIFLGNIKGGVGKSTLCIYIFEMLRKIRPDLDMLLIDTDPQASSSLMLRNIVPESMLRCMPMGDRYDGAITSMIDGVMKSHLVKDDSVALIDSGAGKIGNVWQLALLCNTIIVPTSLSYTDIRPTIDFINDRFVRKGFFILTIFHTSANSPIKIKTINHITPCKKI